MRRGQPRAEASRECGLSLPELAIAVAIASLLLGLGAPAYHDWISARRLANQAQRLAAALTLARTEAIRRNARVNVCKSADGSRCADHGRWDVGFLTHVDLDGDGNVDPGEAPLRHEPGAEDGITITANAPLDDYVSFTAYGYARRLNGALQMGTFTVCKPGRDGMLVVLSHGGRVRVEDSRTPCP
jgi:type IV fimbrial biogenesis protein FimT